MSKEQNTNTNAELAATIASAVAGAIKSNTAENASEATLKINAKVREKQQRQQSYANKIKTEMETNKNCTTIVIDKLYHKYQPNFTASINGCTVTIPANGQPYKVHNDFAVIILRRMRRLSENIDRMNRGESGQIYEIPNN
jgi:ABC-type Zn2+ transport system substrate-binding protein/surface adhesin